MNLVKWNNRSLSPVFSNVFDDFFKGFDDVFLTDNFFQSRKSNFPATNFREDKTNYYLEVAVPGFQKDNFSVTAENGLLKISGQKEKNDQSYNRKEFSYESFERSFSLPETVNQEYLSATYKDGVLHITLPKNKDFLQKSLPKQIEIQ